MALITTGVAKGLNFLGTDPKTRIPFARVWNGVHRAFVAEPGCWADRCDVTFRGSSAPMMYWTTMNDARYWAIATIRGWARGTVALSRHPSVMALWHRYGIDEVALSLAAHEAAWHIGAYTRSQTGGWPFTPAMITRWVSHYGRPKPRFVEPRPWSLMVECAQGAKERWLDRFARARGWVHRVPIGSMVIERV